MPMVEEKHKLVKQYYKKRDEESRRDLIEARREVAEAISNAKIEWLEEKITVMEQLNFDPAKAWAVMKEVKAMYGGHIKTNTTIKMREKQMAPWLRMIGKMERCFEYIFISHTTQHRLQKMMYGNYLKEGK